MKRDLSTSWKSEGPWSDENFTLSIPKSWLPYHIFCWVLGQTTIVAGLFGLVYLACRALWGFSK